MLNRAEIIGRLGRDLELRYTASGVAVGNVSIAASEKWTDKEGKRQERTEWLNLVFWNKVAEIAHKYTHKGSLIYVEGRIQTRSWEDKEGTKRYTTEIVVGKLVLLDSRAKDSERPPMPGDADVPPAQRPAKTEYARPSYSESDPTPPPEQDAPAGPQAPDAGPELPPPPDGDLPF